MIDIHAHILPNVDDGSDSLDASITMLKEAVQSGVTDIIATPHYCPKRGFDNSIEKIKESYTNLVSAVNELGLPIRIYLGEEIYCSDYDNIVMKLKKGELLTLNETPYVLVEFSFANMPENIFELIYSLNLNGYKPIIAHVERYSWMTMDIACRLKEEGCFLQTNASSFRAIRKMFISWRLKRRKLIDIVASDVHSKRTECFNGFGKLYNDEMSRFAKKIIG